MLFREIHLIDYRRPLAKRREDRRYTSGYRWRPSDAREADRVGFYQASDRLAMDKAGSPVCLRLSEANEHLSECDRRRWVTGYYCDEHGDGETLKPIVATLPRGRGFLAGWTMGEGMCANLERTVLESAADAADRAHDIALRDGEEACRLDVEERQRLEEEEAEEIRKRLVEEFGGAAAA